MDFPRQSLIMKSLLKSRKQIIVEGIGPVLLEKSKRAKRILITINREGAVRVAVPRFAPFRFAEKAAREKAEWIRKQHERIRRQQIQKKAFLKNLQPQNIPKQKRFLETRCRELSEKYGLPFNHVRIKNQKTRWGSCSSWNNINLNAMLYHLPAELRDYVILHELVHTRYRDHGGIFWRELERLLPEAPNLRKRMKEFNWLL